MNTTINIPEKPEIGTQYYSPLIAYGRAETICNVWDDDRIDEDRFSYGLCHLDRGSAKQHAKALLSLTARATPSTPSADVGLNHHRTKVDRLEKALAVITVHKLKTWPSYFYAVARGEKTFEIRKNDRDFKVGDVLILQCYDPDKGTYTGHEVVKKVTYITDWEQKPGNVVLGLHSA